MALFGHIRLLSVLLGTFLSFCLLLYECKKLDGYKFPVYSTQLCPRNHTEWNERSSAINCTENNGYLCFPNEKFTQLLEFCHTARFVWIQEGFCLYLRKDYSTIHSYNCSSFQSGFGCHKSSFPSYDLFKYPSCTSIGNGCFLAEPSCKGIDTTTQPPETTKTIHVEIASMNANKTLENNEFATNDEVTIIPIVYGVLISISLFCIACIIYRGATKENNDKKRNSDEERESCSELSNTVDGASNWNKKYGERNMPVKITIKKKEERGKNLKQKPVTEKYTPKTKREKIKNIKNKANSMSTRLASTHPFSKGTHNQKCVLSSEIKAQVSRSVGLIYVDKMPAGTGFRVGEMYIVTCAHVIENVFQFRPHFIACDRMAIEFERKIFNQREDSSQIFLFQNDVAYLDEEHDFVVLKLKCHHAGVGFPPPVTCFGKVSISEIHIVGHPDGREMKEDDIFPYWSTEHKNKIKELGNWSKDFFPDMVDYYSILLEPPEKILFDTTFAQGASGSPGVIIRHNKPCLVLILAGGTPKFIYDNPYSMLQVKDDQKVEYGFPICDIFQKMCSSSKQNDRDLASNIFTEFI